MTFDEAERFLASLVNHEQRAPTSRDFVLEPIRQLLSHFNNPQDQLYTVHITGTKGKGSVAWMLENIVRHAGYRTGLYTSPELNDFNERIRYNGIPIPPEPFAEILTEIRDIIHTKNINPTYFDVTTALGLIYFARQNVDIAIVEVGIGGRTDSTNICKSNIAIITSISYDHTQHLGRTLAAIAREKAGIFKPGSVAISGATDAEPRAVIREVAESVGVPFRELGADFSYEYRPDLPGVTTHGQSYQLSLLGRHQAANAAVAVEAIHELRYRGWKISDNDIQYGLANVRHPARIEVVRRDPLVIVDCAHNTASIHALVETLNVSFPDSPREKRTCIFSASRDKDIEGMLKILKDYFPTIYFTSYSKSGRSATGKELAKIGPGTPYHAHPIDAWKNALDRTPADGMIVITGSVFLAGELREEIVPSN